MDDLMKAALSQGFGYALFVFLLAYVLKTTGDREKQLNATIKENIIALVCAVKASI